MMLWIEVYKKARKNRGWKWGIRESERQTDRQRDRQRHWGVLLLLSFKWISRHVLWLPLFGFNWGSRDKRGNIIIRSLSLSLSFSQYINTLRECINTMAAQQQPEHHYYAGMPTHTHTDTHMDGHTHTCTHIRRGDKEQCWWKWNSMLLHDSTKHRTYI